MNDRILTQEEVNILLNMGIPSKAINCIGCTNVCSIRVLHNDMLEEDYFKLLDNIKK